MASRLKFGGRPVISDELFERKRCVDLLCSLEAMMGDFNRRDITGGESVGTIHVLKSGKAPLRRTGREPVCSYAQPHPESRSPPLVTPRVIPYPASSTRSSLTRALTSAAGVHPENCDGGSCRTNQIAR